MIDMRRQVLLAGLAILLVGILGYYGSPFRPRSDKNRMAAARTRLEEAFNTAQAYRIDNKVYPGNIKQLREAGYKNPSWPKSYVIGFYEECVTGRSPVSELDLKEELNPTEELESALEEVRAAFKGNAHELCPAPSDGIIMLAVGNTDFDKDLDIWAINQSGLLSHLKTDTLQVTRRPVASWEESIREVTSVFPFVIRLGVTISIFGVILYLLKLIRRKRL